MNKNKPSLKILVCSANIGNAEPDMDSIRAWVPTDGACDQVTPLQGIKKDKLASGQFDMVVIGMQESTWKKPSKMERKESKEDKEVGEEVTVSVAPPPSDRKMKRSASSLSMLEGKDAHDSVALKRMFQEALGDGYLLIGQQQRGQMRLHMWVRDVLADDIEPEDIVIKGENTGIGGVLANKGGIVATLTYKKTRITFLSAHLAAHEGEQYYTARCDNIKEILRGAKTFEKFDAAISSHYMFILGDLNFRSKFGEYGDLEHEEKFEKAMNLINAKDYLSLYAYDELQLGIKNGELLVNFMTLPCNFPPTFKMLREKGFVYKDQRVPSYTDRILFKAADGMSKYLKPLAYEPCPDFTTSDHKPIRGAFTLRLNEGIGNSGSDEETLPNSIRLVFSNMSCTDLPVMDVGGSSDPYIKFIWDGANMSSDGESGKSRRTLMGSQSKWPRTKTKPKTLNPVWSEEVGLIVDTLVGTDAILFITVMDYDAASQDDLMCTLPLNIRKLMRDSMRDHTRKVVVDRPLLKYGKPTGRIKFDVTISDLASNQEAANPKKKQGIFSRAKGYFKSDKK